MRDFIRITAKILGCLFVFFLALAILNDMPRWGLNVIIFALTGIALHLWLKCDKWSIRYLQKAGYEEWSKVCSEVN